MKEICAYKIFLKSITKFKAKIWICNTNSPAVPVIIIHLQINGIYNITRKPVGFKLSITLKSLDLLAISNLKDVIFDGVNRELLTHILTNVPNHPQTSDLDDYSKLSLWLSLKIHRFVVYSLMFPID